jgi:hypothetical protein
MVFNPDRRLAIFLPVPIQADRAHEFSRQIEDGGNHATGDHVAINLGEPPCDRIVSSRVHLHEMQMNAGMLGEEGPQPLDLVN